MKLVDWLILIAIICVGAATVAVPIFSVLPSPTQEVITAMATAAGTLLLSAACAIGTLLLFCWVLFD